MRSPQGGYTNIVPPDAIETGVTQLGTIIGNYDVLHGGAHAFVRDLQGTITSFDLPGGAGTYATSINDFGVITGSNGPSGYGTLGFLRVPY